jgi:multidrug efflux pump subunit AcrA (membrane-fusion protein)
MNRKQIILGLVVACGGLAVAALIKMKSHAAGEAQDEATPTLVSVQVGHLKRATVHGYVEGFGTVGPAPASAEEPAAGASLAAPVAGVVIRVHVLEGQHVQKGDVLVGLNSGAATVDNAEQEVERQKLLFEQHNTSLRTLQNAQAQLALLRVTAPLSGTVTRFNVKPGEAVDVSTIVAEVMDLSRLAVSARIPAAEADGLKAGETVQVLTRPPVTATLSFVSPVVDTNNGTVLARAALPADSGLRPGQFVQLRVVTVVHFDSLVAPGESVVTDEQGHSVIAIVTGDAAKQQPVKTGLREDGWVEIEGQGLKEGDTVVTVGAYGLPEKTKVRVLE